jgi:hypothetical protein
MKMTDRRAKNRRARQNAERSIAIVHGRQKIVRKRYRLGTRQKYVKIG